MGEMVIITSKEDLKALLKEIVLEVLPQTEPLKPQSDLVNCDDLIAFFAENGYKTSKSQLYKLTRSRAIPFMKVGNKLLFSKSELMNWLTFKKHKMSIKYVPRKITW